MSIVNASEFESLRGVSVLVTGGAGFIGSHLVRGLLDVGAHVRVLDDLSSGHRANLWDDATFIEGSILDDAALRDAVTGCAIVLHEAAMVSVPRERGPPGTVRGHQSDRHAETH